MLIESVTGAKGVLTVSPILQSSSLAHVTCILPASKSDPLPISVVLSMETVHLEVSH